jgi:hypothetical protein
VKTGWWLMVTENRLRPVMPEVSSTVSVDDIIAMKKNNSASLGMFHGANSLFAVVLSAHM